MTSNRQQRTLPLAVSAALIIDRGKVLLTQRPPGSSFAGMWEFPGGKLEQEESPHQALIRELQEELGIQIGVKRILTSVYHNYDWGSVLIMAYLCSWESGEIRHLEVSDHHWVSPAQFSNYNILPADGPILAKLTRLLADQ